METLFPRCQGVTWSRAWLPPPPARSLVFDWVSGLSCATPLAATPVASCVQTSAFQGNRGTERARNQRRRGRWGAGLGLWGSEVSRHVSPAPRLAARRRRLGLRLPRGSRGLRVRASPLRPPPRSVGGAAG
uniref:Uncharacterized protein n=1 Tax=Myotis myotis TaxID=51298 RepID=A0A7J7VIG7_MYOMY|nr:hypothetical protein mMyoMyo1_008388 [Myotis myotis]